MNEITEIGLYIFHRCICCLCFSFSLHTARILLSISPYIFLLAPSVHSVHFCFAHLQRQGNRNVKEKYRKFSTARRMHNGQTENTWRKELFTESVSRHMKIRTIMAIIHDISAASPFALPCACTTPSSRPAPRPPVCYSILGLNRLYLFPVVHLYWTLPLSVSICLFSIRQPCLPLLSVPSFAIPPLPFHSLLSSLLFLYP